MARMKWLAAIVTVLLMVSSGAYADPAVSLPFSRSDQHGLIQQSGEMALSAKYSQIVWLPVLNDSGVQTGVNNKMYSVARGADKSARYALFSQNGKQLTDFSFRSLYQIGDRIFGEGGRSSQLLSESGKLILQPGYDVVTYSGGMVSAYNQASGGQGVCFDKDGRRMSDAVYERIGPFAQGMAMVVMNGKAGYVDENLSVVIPLDWEASALGDFSGGGGAPARQGSLWGMIGKNGKWIVEPKWARVSALPGDRFAVAAGDLFALADAKGKVLTKYAYRSLTYDSKGFYRADGGALLDASGAEIRAPEDAKNCTITPISQTRFAVNSQNGRSGVIDDNRAWVTSAPLASILYAPQTDALRFSEPDAPTLYGLMDSNGKTLIAPAYRALAPSVGAYWTAEKDGQYGVINSTGQWWVKAK